MILMLPNAYYGLKISAAAVVFCLFLGACKTPPPTEGRAGEAAEIESMYQKIVSLSSKKPCKDATNWSYIAVGKKACGGPITYLPYSNSINVTKFKELVQKHYNKQNAFNKKYGITSDCMIEPEPTGVVCHEGKPLLVYDDAVEK